MDSQPMLEPVDRPVGMTAAGDPIAQRVGWSSPGPPAAEAGVVEAPRTRSLFLRSHLESVIQQHPWPTLLLGIAAGYLLARRLR
ncbi:MAG TPA: hypothetical protein VFS39_10545 [Nitrospira sp.]|nr:hypothetical protein [Nitrospira sp.]